MLLFLEKAFHLDKYSSCYANMIHCFSSKACLHKWRTEVTIAFKVKAEMLT